MAIQAFIVEDNPTIRDSLSETLLELAGIETVGVATSEHAAVAALRAPHAVWDVAIVDLILEPGGSGLGVLHALKDRDPARRVVVLTGAATQRTRDQCLSLGADRVFDKSMETDALIEYCAAMNDAAGAPWPVASPR